MSLSNGNKQNNNLGFQYSCLLNSAGVMALLRQPWRAIQCLREGLFFLKQGCAPMFTGRYKQLSLIDENSAFVLNFCSLELTDPYTYHFYNVLQCLQST